eukprot:m.198820 g.198820  ORF g.198820 m.198820 type:complete len:544 (-) comp15720_c1_seq6:234-1865(-)
MMLKIVLIGLAALIIKTDGHGFMTHPMSRNYIARQPPQITEYCPHCLAAGGPSVNQQKLQAKTGDGTYPYPETVASSARHGLCGDIADTQQKYISNSTNHLTSFVKDSVVTLEFIITAHHRGHFEISLCDMGTVIGSHVTQECLEKNVLIRAEDSNAASPIDPAYPERYYLEPVCAKAQNDQMYTGTLDGSVDYATQYYGYGLKVRAKYHLPKNFTCEHCVLQWWWITANTCHPPGYQSSSVWNHTWNCAEQPGADWWVPGLGDCGERWPEEFWNCADISITDDGQGPTGVTQPTPPATTTQGSVQSSSTQGSNPTQPPESTTQNEVTSSQDESTTQDTMSTQPYTGQSFWFPSYDNWNGGCNLVLNIVVPMASSTWQVVLKVDKPISNLHAWDSLAEDQGNQMYLLSNKDYNAVQEKGDILTLGMTLQLAGTVCVEILELSFNGVVVPAGDPNDLEFGTSTASPSEMTTESTTGPQSTDIQADTGVCGTGTEYDNGVCTPTISCGPGTIKQGNTCVLACGARRGKRKNDLLEDEVFLLSQTP